MQRDLAQLKSKTYDLIVIGGGIYGACLAWDAALRGLSVALIEKADFGHATSANSLKIIHGGLRYLQDGNLLLMRTMIQERKTWLRIAPHLVHPLPFLIPTDQSPTKNKLALTIALKLNDWISYDRNHAMDPQKYLPNGRIISKAGYSQIVPGMTTDQISGGAIWYDAQMYNSERLLLSIVLAAVAAGAEVANYIEATNFLHHDDGIRRVEVRDGLTGQCFKIKSKLVANCTGGWTDQLLGLLKGHTPTPKFRLSIAVNLITRQVISDYAVGVTGHYLSRDGQERSRVLFITPWHGYSLIGTIHLPYDGRPQDFQITDELIAAFVDEINRAYPASALTERDVYHVHWGFLPMEANNSSLDEVKLMRQGQVHDHEQEDGLAGLITVVGVKYTTARIVAQRAVDLIFRKLDRQSPPCLTQKTPVWGGNIERFEVFLVQTQKQCLFDLSLDTIQRLVHAYGSEYFRILRYFDENPVWEQPVTPKTSVLKAEIVHAVRHEMAHKLADVVRRRTELGAVGLPDEATLQVCSELMAAELGWSQHRVEQELNEVRTIYRQNAWSVKEKMGQI